METNKFATEKLYEKKRTLSGTLDEANKYLEILQNHSDLFVTFYLDSDEEDKLVIPLKLESWNKIKKLLFEQPQYSLGHVLFSSIKTIEDFEAADFLKTYFKRKPKKKEIYFKNNVEEAKKIKKPTILSGNNKELFNNFANYFSNRQNKSSHIIKSDEKIRKKNVKDKIKKEIPEKSLKNTAKKTVLKKIQKDDDKKISSEILNPKNNENYEDQYKVNLLKGRKKNDINLKDEKKKNIVIEIKKLCIK